MKALLITLITLTGLAHAELPPMEFTPFPPMQFEPFPNPNDFPEGTSFACKESNGQFLLFRYEKKTCPNGGLQFQSQSIEAFDVEQNCIDKAELYNTKPEQAPRSRSQQQRC